MRDTGRTVIVQERILSVTICKTRRSNYLAVWCCEHLQTLMPYLVKRSQPAFTRIRRQKRHSGFNESLAADIWHVRHTRRWRTCQERGIATYQRIDIAEYESYDEGNRKDWAPLVCLTVLDKDRFDYSSTAEFFTDPAFLTWVRNKFLCGIMPALLYLVIRCVDISVGRVCIRR